MPDEEPRTIRVAIRVTPGARRAAIGGSHGDALSVRVTARAVDGKATAAACKAVATALGVRPRQVRLVAGATSRDKLVEVEGDPAELARRLAELRAQPE